LGKPLQKKTVTPICCDHIFEDVISLYTAFESLPQHELNVKFEGEMGVDLGGLTEGMHMFKAFWQEAYKCLFNGGELLIPVLCPGINPKNLLLLERILSHGYLIAGFLPIRIAFPCLVVALLGAGHTVPDNLACDYFLQSLSTFEANVIKNALDTTDHTF